MKTCILLIACFSYLTGIVYSNTYVWEDYDDFSGSSLDTSKWGVITFNGGIEPYHQNGSLMLSSNAQDLNAIPQNDAEWDEFVADLKQWGDPEVFAYIKDSSIRGVQASFSMPSGSADGTFVDLSFYEVDSSGQEVTMTGIGIGLSQENGITKIKIETEGVVFNADPIAANISQTYTFSIINIGDTCEIFLDGVKVGEISLVNFQPNLISLSAYNENQQGYNIETDNVRVLRQASTTSLDGSIFTLSSTDGVSETMSFENGTFTSSFVDSQKSTTITSNQSYILDSMSSNSWKITLNDGDVYSFDSSVGTGTLTDYENGVMDTSGSFNFTYIRNTWMDYDDFSDNSLDTSKWTATSSYFVGNQPTEANGRIELSGLTSQYSNTFLLFQDSEGIDGVEADIWLPSDAPVDTGVLIGIADAGTPVGYLDLWADSAQTHFSIGLDNSSTGESVDFTRNAELGKMYKVAIIKGEQKTALYLDGEKMAEVSTWQSNYLDIIFRGVNNAGSSFTAYLDNVRVLRNWEDYDDFSSGTLDASKWDLWWGAGGALPTVVNDALQLSGSGNTSDPASSVIPNDLSYIAAERLPDMHSMALINQDDIYGIQAEFMIPSGPSDDTGLNLIFFDWAEDGSSKQEYGPELEYRSENGLRLEFAYTDPTSAESMQITRTAAFDTYYKMSIIHTETTSSMYSNGELIKEFSSVGFNPDTLGFAAFNDDGLPYTTYIKNVRVLRRSSNLPLINVAPAKIEGERDLVYLQSPSGPSLLAGAGEINFDLELADRPTVSAASLKVDGNVFDVTQNQGPTVFRTRYGYGTGEPNELYDIESSSSSDWSAYANGMKFEFSLTINGSEYTYFHDLPGEAELPSPPSPSISGAGSWKKDQSGYDYVEVSEAENYVVSWDPFVTSDSNDFIVVSLVEQIGDEEKDILGDVNLTVATSSYEISGNLLEKNKSYLFYLGFSNVVQSENPTGFTHSVGSNTTESLLRTSANSITALGFMIEETETITVVSDPNGQAVVLQVGNEYQWNSTLDGVTLWSVDQSQSSGDIQPITMRFENGRNFGSEGFFDSIAQPQPYDMPFVIDENGYIKVSEDNGYQYYHVVSVENGIIATLEGDEQGVVDDGVNVADQWFFTTRAAAEEYYYSKVNPKDWMWFDQYPWVYSSEMQEWLYFYPSGSKLLYYSNKNQAWREFSQ